MKVTMRLAAMNNQGYLTEPAEWNEDVAEEPARRENVEPMGMHRDAIRFMRGHYQEHQVMPDVRQVVKHLSKQCHRFPARQPTHRVSNLPCGFGRNRPTVSRPGTPFSKPCRN